MPIPFNQLQPMRSTFRTVDCAAKEVWFGGDRFLTLNICRSARPGVIEQARSIFSIHAVYMIPAARLEFTSVDKITYQKVKLFMAVMMRIMYRADLKARWMYVRKRSKYF